MMPETAGEEAAAPAGYAERLARLDAYLAQCAEVLPVIAGDPDRPDLSRQVNQATAAARELRAVLAARVLGDDLLAAAEARAEQRGFERGLAAAARRKGRHAAQSSRALHLVQGAIPAALRASRPAQAHPWITQGAHHLAAGAKPAAAS